MSKIYQDGTYLEKNPTWHEQDSPWKADNIIKILEKNRVEFGSLCEIGCGAGEILHLISKHYGEDKEFTGYDISPQAYEIASKKESNNLKFINADLSIIDSLHTDVVLAIDVMEHIENYFSFLRKLKSIGEYKILHIPLDLSVQSVLRASPLMRCRRNVGHIHYFTKETAFAALEETGYEVIDYFYTKGSLDIKKQSWKTSMMKIPRRMLFAVNQDLAARILGGFSLMVLAK